jgi:threonine dehydrogenase-like Zn-dependent dehydrogenase
MAYINLASRTPVGYRHNPILVLSHSKFLIANMSGKAKTMRAVLWEGKVENMTVKDVPIPSLQHPEDVIIRVTVAAICGSDLHIWHGEIGSSKVPWIMGHEAIGIVTEVGKAVDTIKVGDKVVIPDFPDPGNIVVEASQVQNPMSRIGAGIYGVGDDFGRGLGGCQGKQVARSLIFAHAAG